MVSKLVGLTPFGVCVLHCTELDWVGECVAGLVTCKLARTEDLCHWPTVLRSICYVGEWLACRELPNDSFLFPYCMFSIIPVFPLQCRIRVCLVRVMHMLKLGYWFLCTMCVPYILFLLIIRLSYIWIVARVTFEFVYPAGMCAGLNYFVSELSMYSVCGTKGHKLECLNRLIIFPISVLWNENVAHFLASCIVVVGSFCLCFWLSVSSSCCEWYAMEINYFGLLHVWFFHSCCLACFVIGSVSILFMQKLNAVILCSRG